MKTRGVPDSHPNPPGWNPSHPGGGGGQGREGPARNWFGLAVEAGSLKGKELVGRHGGERAQGPHLLSCISNIILRAPSSRAAGL